MTKQKIEAIYPLTSMQHALLMHGLYANDDKGFIHVQCRLIGDLNVELFRRSWQKTIDRHPSMRSSIHWKEIEKPVRVVHPMAKLPYNMLDWSHITPEKQKEKLEALKHADRSDGFDLSVPPVSRLTIIKLTENEHLLLWSCHHILLDGWSATTVVKDMFKYYDALCDGQNVVLDTLPSYQSYLNWVKRQDTEGAEVFWKDTLKDFNVPSMLAHRRLSDNGHQISFKDHIFSLTATFSSELQDHVRQQRITLNTFVQGMWGLLLSRFFDLQDVAFGNTTSTRSIPLPNAELMAGLFMNVLPFRIKLKPDLSVSEWLADIQIQQSKIRNYEHTTLDQIITWTKWPGYLPMFDSLLVFENFPWKDIKSGNITVKDYEGGLTTVYPLNVIIKPRSEPEFHFHYNPNEVSDETVSWLSDNLKFLLKAAVADPEATVADMLNKINPFVSTNLNGRPKPKSSAYDVDNKEASAYVPPKNEMELQLTKIWEEVLGKQPIGVQDHFFKIGGRSLLAVRLFARIEQEMGRNVSPAVLLQYPTIESLAKVLSDDSAEQNWSSLVPLRATGSKRPLFCIHGGGGHIFFYNALAHYLGADQPVYAMQAVGPDGVESFHNTIEEMASHYLEEIRNIQPEGPYNILGMCFSNAVCLQLAIQMEQAGQQVSLMGIVDSAPGQLIPVLPGKRDRIKYFSKLALKGRWDTLFTSMRSKMRPFTRNLIPDKRSKQEKNLEIAQDALRKMYMNYTWIPCNNKITLFRSEEFSNRPDKKFHVIQWSGLTHDELETIIVPGNHVTLFDEPHVREFARLLGKRLNLTQEELVRS